MATNIYNYDGTLLTTVQDSTIATTNASIKFPGRGYLNYGQPVNENMLWIMQNFAGTSAPSNPLQGQLWYDTSIGLIKCYNGSTWQVADGVQASPTNPGSGLNVGAFWYDTTNNQLFVWSGTTWLLVGPLGSSNNTDPTNPVISTYSRIQAARLSDGATTHQVWLFVIGGTLLGILSKDAEFTPSPTITGFSTIKPGLNLNSTIGNIGVSGDPTLYRSTQNNTPSVDNNFDLGSNSLKFANVYSTNFVGRASSALYADLAEIYRSDRVYPAGTLISLGGLAEITVSAAEGSSDVFGVISTDPAYLMNNIVNKDEFDLPVALTGRVPCRVIGTVKKGQRLMASGLEGAACAWNESYGLLAIVGRSLVDKHTSNVETIEIFVGKN